VWYHKLKQTCFRNKADPKIRKYTEHIKLSMYTYKYKTLFVVLMCDVVYHIFASQFITQTHREVNRTATAFLLSTSNTFHIYNRPKALSLSNIFCLFVCLFVFS
jgi:hypothetical protein